MKITKTKKRKRRAQDGPEPEILKRLDEQRKAARARREEIVTRLNRRNRAS